MATRKKRPLQSKASLLSDWYWEQDAQLRFVRVEVQTGTPGEQELAEKNLGRRPWETGISVEGGWEAHRALLATRAPFREVLMWRDFDDGSRRYISVSGQPVFDAKGRFTGYRGVGRDITRQKRGEQLLRLQHTVTRRLAEATDPVQGTQEALRAVCETEGWDVGQFWRLDPAAGVMRRFAHWIMPGVDAAQRFADASRDVEFAQGVGLVGAAWHSGKPVWIPDSTQDARARRKALAEETGLRGTLLCPVQLDGSVVGVLNFDCRKIRPPDESLLQALIAVATQISLYLRRAESEARLRESEERFRRTFELAGSGVAHLSLERRFLRVNRKLCEILGYSEDELIGRPVQDVSHPEDMPHTSAERERLYAGEIDSLSMEKRYLRKDRSLVWAALTLALERDAEGKPLYEIAVYDDVTARKAAEEAMRESEERFRRTFELAGSGLAHVGLDGRFLRANRRLCEMFGYPESELVGRSVKELSHPDDRDLTDSERARMRRGETDLARFEKRYLRKDGSTLWVNMSVALERDQAGAPLYEISVLDDIGARKAAETALRDSEARFRHTFELAGVGVAHIGPDRRFLRVNRRFCEILGYAEAELIGRTGRELSHPEDLDAMNAQRPALYAGTIDAVRGEKRYLRKDGSVVWVAYTLAIERDSAGNPLYEIAVYDDISARKAAEDALRESEARFRALTEMSSDFFWETDAQHRLTDMVYGRSFAGRMDDALGKLAWEVPSTHPDAAGWAALRAKVDAHQPFRDFEFGRPRSNGAVRYLSVSGEPRLAADGRFLGYRGVGRDITDLVLARERIVSLAYHDALTGLANRTSLAPALEQAVERTHRRGSKLAGLFLDLDGFKQVNDLHGHDAGDRLLVEAAQRLRAALRSSDPLARLGGDEFFVVLEDLHSNAPAERVAQKLLAALLQPYDLGGDRQARISASIGISVYPDDAGDAATLMKHADSAMYSAKQAGKNAYRFFVGGPAANDGRAASEEKIR